jgi:hypothetical protein
MDAKVAARIEALTHSPAWDDLTAELQKQEDKFWTRHIADMKDGKAFNQREMDYALGKLDGIHALLRVPVKAATIMERQAKEEEAS